MTRTVSTCFGALALLAAVPALAAPSASDLPRRLVLGVDGVSYFDVQYLQQTGQAFTEFNPVSRDISTFPSISDVSWADIFQTVPPDGYQRYHYSVGENRIIGGSLSDLSNPIEYERRMNVGFDRTLHHAYSYMFAGKSVIEEVKEFSRKLLLAHGMDTFYVYMLSTDTLQHTDGDIIGALKYIDRSLVELQKEYTAKTGHPLEIALVSDHGNNHEDHGKRVPLKEFLAAHGYRVTDRIQQPKDVAFTCAGILTAIAMYTADEEIEPLIETVLPLEGVDLITNAVGADGARIRKAVDGDILDAYVYRKPGTDKYRYVAVSGDPIDYLPVVDELRAEGKLDADGFASADDWLAATSGLKYPDAIERIYRGHHAITKNPAKILISLKDGYENANGFVKFLTHFKKRGGTHGALSDRDSDGIVLTNFMKTHDVTTNRVHTLLNFAPLYDYRRAEAGARFIDSEVQGEDLDSKQPVVEDDNLGVHHDTFLNLWDPQMPLLEKMGVRTTYRFVTKHDGFAFFNRTISRKAFLADSLPHVPSFEEFRVPVDLLVPTPLKPGNYFVKIYADRLDSKTGKRLKSDAIYVARFFTDLDGQVLPY